MRKWISRLFSVIFVIITLLAGIHIIFRPAIYVGEDWSVKPVIIYGDYHTTEEIIFSSESYLPDFNCVIKLTGLQNNYTFCELKGDLCQEVWCGRILNNETIKLYMIKVTYHHWHLHLYDGTETSYLVLWFYFE